MTSIASRDVRSTTGKNLRLVQEMSGLDPWEFGPTRVKHDLVMKETVQVPQQDQWRVGYLSRLLEERQELHYSGDKDGEERVSGLIDSLCIN